VFVSAQRAKIEQNLVHDHWRHTLMKLTPVGEQALGGRGSMLGIVRPPWR
jgi:hypothetical protein